VLPSYRKAAEPQGSDETPPGTFPVPCYYVTEARETARENLVTPPGHPQRYTLEIPVILVARACGMRQHRRATPRQPRPGLDTDAPARSPIVGRRVRTVTADLWHNRDLA
jgi:hypothetical protein